jgi:carboxypeptidase family protein
MRSRSLMIMGLALLVSSALLAQGTGSISGVVQDESGAVIPGAGVTVVNVDTGISSSFESDATGAYHVPSLIPGPYEIRAQKSGFETAIRRGVQLAVGSDLNINMPLKVGQVAQSTVVNAEAPIVDTINSSLSNLVDDKTIRDLPLNGRSFDQLIALDSAAPTFRSRGRFSTYGQVDVYTVNGSGEASNVYLMDGTEMEGTGLGYQIPGGVLGVNTGVDAIQEFSVMTGNFAASYGKKAGAIVNIATKSGTNQFHGTAYEYLRNSHLDARNFFDGLNIPAFKRNQFGGALGGPIKKDNSFFFVNYEGLRQGLGVSKVAVVPDANSHKGLLPCAQAPGVTCNASTGLANVGVAQGVAPYLNTLFPSPNGQSFGDGTAAYITNPTQITNLNLFLVRFDQRISDKDSFFGRFNYDKSDQSSPSYLTQIAPQYFVAAGNHDYNATLEEKRIFSPTLINLVRFGFSRAKNFSTGGAYNATDPALQALNFVPNPGTLGTIRFTASANVVAQQGLSGVSSGTCANACSVGGDSTTQFEESDQVFKYLGRHSLQFGVGIQRNQGNNGDQFPTQGTYVFAGGLLSFLQGRPSQFTGVTPGAPWDNHKGYRKIYFSTYIQDDYKVRKNLTLNLGLRYELFTAPVEVTDRLSNYHYTYNAAGLIVLDPKPTLGGAAFQGNHLNFAPRVGFAWDPRGNGKTAVRGGFGVFYDQDLQSARFYLGANPPYTSSVSISNPAFPTPFAAGPAGSAPLPAPSTLDPNWKTPTKVEWTLSIQQQITSSSMISIGYVGAEGSHFGRQTNANTFVPTFLLNGQGYAYPIAGSTTYFPTGQLRLQPALSPASRFITTNMNTSYNALQMGFTQRLSHGLRGGVSYTWSKNIDTGPGFIASYANGELGVTENPFNASAERGLSPYNLPYNFTTNVTYDIPWSKKGWSSRLFGGWQAGGIFTTHEGTPFTVSDGFNNSRSGDTNNPDRPNLAPGFTSDSIILGGPNTYFNSHAFTLPAAGFFGNVSRNILKGPGFGNLDFSAHKSITVTERVRADFRAEFFNILNHANFDLPSATIFNSNGTYLGSAGHVSQTLTTSRQIQMGLKFIF